MNDCDYQGESCDGVAVHFFECRETGHREQCCESCRQEMRDADGEAYSRVNAEWAERIGHALGLDDGEASP